MWSDIGKGTIRRIPFRHVFKPKLEVGRKTTTFRSKVMCPVGERFTAFEMIFEVVDMKYTTLEDVRTNYLYQEGCDTVEEFDRIWVSIHPIMGLKLDYMGYLHFFNRKDVNGMG